MISFNNLWISTIRSGKGDCIHVRYIGLSGDAHNIIIDTGPTSTSGEFRKLCQGIISSGERIDALFITHYDDDHIGGALKVTDLPVCSLYFNAYQGSEVTENLSATQNQRLFHTANAENIHSTVVNGDVIELDGMKISIIAPDEKHLRKAKVLMKEADRNLSSVSDWSRSFAVLADEPYPSPDTSISNLASIVMIMENEDKRLLLCGDAPAESIVKGLKQPTRFDLVKLPHHGSSRNILDEMIQMIDADVFLICADGTSHPNKQTIAKLLKWKDKIRIYCNYSWWLNGFILPEDRTYLSRIDFKQL